MVEVRSWQSTRGGPFAALEYWRTTKPRRRTVRFQPRAKFQTSLSLLRGVLHSVNSTIYSIYTDEKESRSKVILILRIKMYRVIEQELNFTPQIQDTESTHTQYICDETGHKLKTSPGPAEETNACTSTS